jgi:hypothetical protein
MSLYVIRWQETWGEQTQGVFDDPCTGQEVPRVLGGWAGDWFPSGFTLVPDSDSLNTWLVTGSDGRRLWFFVEPVGGGG